MASEERFSNEDDHREEQEILDDLESIKDLLDDEAVASQEASGDHAEAEEPVPILDDLVEGALSVTEADFDRTGPASDGREPGRVDQAVFDALLGDEWKAAASGLLTEARGAIEAHRNEWTPEDTDELNEALRVRIDETLTAWLRQTIAERVHELRTELLEVAEGVITERIALLEARRQDDRATEDG
jgi:hypothetical protein